MWFQFETSVMEIPYEQLYKTKNKIFILYLIFFIFNILDFFQIQIISCLSKYYTMLTHEIETGWLKLASSCLLYHNPI